MNEELTLFPLIENSQLSSKTIDRLYQIFEDIHNHIYANDGLSSQQVFSEILKILFLKIFDEKNNKTQLFYITKNEFSDIIEGNNNKTFLARVYELSYQAFAYFVDVFKQTEEIGLKLSSLAYAVQKLQDINLYNSSRDIKGLAFQKFVHTTQRSERGQFFTPEQVVKLCVEIIKPQKEDKILDPACGSGGFLSEAMKYVYDHSLYGVPDNKKRDYVKAHLFGIEINAMVARMAKMRMILEGDGFSNILNIDSLSNWDNINNAFNKANGGLEDYHNYFDIILTNPPFGSQGRITNKAILQKYDLAHKWLHDEVKTTSLLNGQVPDILFIERCLDFLKEGGKLAIVLPNGDLENSSLHFVRNYIRSMTEILAIVDLPSDTFIPFGTGVKTSILFLQKKKNTFNQSGHKVFFGKINKIGYEGNKNATIIYKKDANGNYLKNKRNELLIDEDITEVTDSYNKFLQNNFHENDNTFLVDKNKITNRFDLDFYKPSSHLLDKMLKKKGAQKLGDLVEIVKEKTKKIKEAHQIVQYVELSDINTEYMEISQANILPVHRLPSRASYELNEGDIITAVAGNSIGTKKHMSALVSKQYAGAICTNGFRILKPKHIDPYYLLFYLRTEYYLHQVTKFRTGAAIPSISDQDLQNILVIIPSDAEQKRIAQNIKKSIELRETAQNLLHKTSLMFK